MSARLLCKPSTCGVRASIQASCCKVLAKRWTARVLACNTHPAAVMANVKPDSRKICSNHMRQSIRHCEASLPCILQVREALTTSAQLRLPQSMPQSQKQARVDQIITELVILSWFLLRPALPLWCRLQT